MNVKKVVVASANPVKISAALDGLKQMFPKFEFRAEPVKVPSGVADQPFTDQETLQGAPNRVENAQMAMAGADVYVGLEGGVEWVGEELAAFAWIVVKVGNTVGKARSGLFFLPKQLAQLVDQGVELGVANDRIFSQVNSKQKGGAIGILSHGAMGRKELYEQAVVLALVPFKNPELYQADASLVEVESSI